MYSSFDHRLLPPQKQKQVFSLQDRNFKYREFSLQTIVLFPVFPVPWGRCRQTDRQADRQAEWQTNRQIDMSRYQVQTHRQTDIRQHFYHQTLSR